ncbi:sensor histidine kinase [Actinomadura sediminis]|uniref:histidine kinase n=1 Tax=Actinomadura sediminis TaxID=1038904 RepID=A0ABW3EK22_9ACTN
MSSHDASAWQELCDQLASRVLLLAEQVRPALDELERDEDVPERVRLLYDIDHGVARMRRLARDIRVLAGRSTDEAGTHTSSLLDVVRVAASGIEHYDRLHIGPVADRALVDHAADDVASLLAVLLDNATRCSQAPAMISTRSFGDGSLLVRIEDDGPGVDPAWAEALNRVFVGPVPPLSPANCRRSGFAVAHRLARKHGLGLALVCRRAAEATPEREGRRGTVAMVTIPPHLVCEIPEPVGALLNSPSEPVVDPGPRTGTAAGRRERASFADDVAAFSAATSSRFSPDTRSPRAHPAPSFISHPQGGAKA